MTRPDLPRAGFADVDAHFERALSAGSEVSQFVLHGNVHDLVNCAGQSWAMGDFLGQFFEPSGKLVVHYDPGRGVWFESQEHAVRAAKIWVTADFIAEQKVAPAGLSARRKLYSAGESAREIGFERSRKLSLKRSRCFSAHPMNRCLS